MTTTSNNLETQLTELQSIASEEINAADSLEQLESLRVGYLGKKGKVSKILGGMGKLDPSDRPKVGKLANEVKTALETALSQKKRTAPTDRDRGPLGLGNSRCHHAGGRGSPRPSPSPQ